MKAYSRCLGVTCSTATLTSVNQSDIDCLPRLLLGLDRSISTRAKPRCQLQLQMLTSRASKFLISVFIGLEGEATPKMIPSNMPFSGFRP